MRKKFLIVPVSIVTAGIMAVSNVIMPFSVSAHTMHTLSYRKYDFQSQTTTAYTLRNSSITFYRSEDIVETRVPDTNLSVVQLRMNGGVGSGFIIDDHTIATAAHCVYSSGFITDLTVAVRNAASTQDLAVLTVDEVHVPYLYIYDSSTKYDYALIYVEEDLSQYGEFNLAVPTDDFMSSGTTVYASGFPVEVDGTDNDGGSYRYLASGTITTMGSDLSDEEPYKIKYTSLISGGDSGGPVYTTESFGDSTVYNVVGIVTGGAPNNYYGTRITCDLLHFYYNNPNIG